MNFQQCDQFFLDRVRGVPHPVIEGWIREVYPGCENLFFDQTFYAEGMWVWLAQTHMCHLSYTDPPTWFVISVWAWYEENRKIIPFTHRLEETR